MTDTDLDSGPRPPLHGDRDNPSRAEHAAAGPDIVVPTRMTMGPRPRLQRAAANLGGSERAAAGPSHVRKPKDRWPAAVLQPSDDTLEQNEPAAGPVGPCDPSHARPAAALAPMPELQTIRELHRRHQDLIRASVALSNQASAICRRLVCDCRTPDPASAAHKRHLREAAALLKSVESGEVASAIAEDALFSCLVLLQGRATIEKGRADVRKLLSKAVRALPLWREWAAHVRGLGACSLGQILGELGDPAKYATVSKVWTRMGVGLVESSPGAWVRQRKVASAEGALLHQYVPARRALLYVIGENLVKLNDAEYRAAYDTKKAEYLTREGWTRMHAHKAAMRFATKRLLRDLWVARRALHPSRETQDDPERAACSSSTPALPAQSPHEQSTPRDPRRDDRIAHLRG